MCSTWREGYGQSHRGGKTEILGVKEILDTCLPSLSPEFSAQSLRYPKPSSLHPAVLLTCLCPLLLHIPSSLCLNAMANHHDPSFTISSNSSPWDLRFVSRLFHLGDDLEGGKKKEWEKKNPNLPEYHHVADFLIRAFGGSMSVSPRCWNQLPWT